MLSTNLNKLAKRQLTLRFALTGGREYNLRSWLALRLIDLLVLIAPFTVEVIRK